MKNNIYINGIGSISSQDNEGIFNQSVMEYNTNVFSAIEPEYSRYIPAMSLRRMSKAVKMGLTASLMALKEAGISMPDAIITATGQGCKGDTEKFLEGMLDQNENFLSPTSFIHSTHNTVGGQIALQLKCNAYNLTYTQNSGSLESALIDAELVFAESKAGGNVLVGGVDEISAQITSFQYLDGQLKTSEIKNTDLYRSGTSGTITSEGAHFFVLSSEKTSHTYSIILGVNLFHAHFLKEVEDNIQKVLKAHHFSVKDLDLVILGNNGDSRFDHFYHELQRGLFIETPQICYKHLTGDYNTVNGYAIWLASKIIKSGNIPMVFKANKVEKRHPRKVLIYNHYLGEHHSIILLGAP